MLGTPEPLRAARDAVYERFLKNELTPEAAVGELRATDPDSALAAFIEGSLLLKRGDLDAAEIALWKTVRTVPSVAVAWFRLGEIHDQRGGDGRYFRLVGLQQIGVSREVPEDIAGALEELGEVARVPEAYALLADRTEAGLADTPWPAELLPFRLLGAVQRHALNGLAPELLDEIFSRYDACVPVFRAALRQWYDDDGASLSDEAAALLIAILGERGAPELIDDLANDEQYPTSEVLWHAQWAVRHIGQRHPAAAFERLQAAAATADLTFRGFLAEQFYFLPPELPGRKEAILRLLDGFPGEGEPEDAAYLLLTVSTLMALLGSPYDARAVLEKHQRRLSAEGREWLAEATEDDEFIPNLAEHGIDELTIADVCTELALMDSTAEDDEDLDGEEDDDDGPAVAETRPGRNDPCWCGSGKKYKKCHLAADDEDARAAASTAAADFRRLIQEIMEASAQKMSRADFMVAHRLFFGRDAGLIEPGVDEEGAFMQWLILDHRPESTGRTGVDEYVRRRGRVAEKDRPLIDAFRNARYCLWEIQRVERGRGIEVKDYFGGEPFFVHDVSSSRSSAQWDCLVAYFFERDGRWEFFGDGFNVPRAFLPQLTAMVEAGAREARLSPSAYFRRRSHEWRRIVIAEAARAPRIVNAEGDELELSAAIYEAADPAAAEAAILAGAPFASDKPGHIVWVDDARAETGRVYGDIRIADGRLRLEANSRKRLAIGRQLVEKYAGEFLRHVEDVLDIRPEGPPPPSSIPPEIERELILKVKAAHYAAWPDEPVPALGGKTPREAVRSETGRRAVEDLLRDFENTEERLRQSGSPAFDFTPLRKQLGL
jgi:hypothetical protein